MRIISVLSVIVAIHICFTGCGSSPTLLLQPIDPHAVLEIKNEPVRYYSEDSSSSVSGVKLTCPSEIRWIGIDSSRQAVLLKFAPRERSSKYPRTLVSYSLSREEIMWAKECGATSGMMEKTHYILRDSYEQIAVSPDSGNIIWRYPASSWLAPSLNIRISSTDKQLSPLVAYDLETGKIVWERIYRIGYHTDWTSLVGEKYYVISDGLEFIDLRTGDGWHIPKSTTDTESELKVLLKGLLGGPLKGEITYHLSSPPYFEDEKLYFGARSEIICCDKGTGKIIWTTPIENSLSVISLANVSPNLMVIFRGWIFKNRGMGSSGVPQAFLLDKVTGKVLSRFETNEEDPIMDFLVTDHSVFLVSNQKLFQLDRDLKLKAVLANSDYGNFIRFITTPDNGILVRSSDGVLAVNESPLSVSWWQKLKSMEIDFDDKGWAIEAGLVGPISADVDASRKGWRDLNHFIAARKYFTETYFTGHLMWTRGEDSFVCIDYREGKRMIEVPLPEDAKSSLKFSGWLAATSGKECYVIRLPEMR